MLSAVALRDGDVDAARSWIAASKAEEAPNSLGDDFAVCVDAQLLAIDGDVGAAFEHIAGAWEICDLIGLKIWFQVMHGQIFCLTPKILSLTGQRLFPAVTITKSQNSAPAKTTRLKISTTKSGGYMLYPPFLCL